jgi:hypothetical protein
VMLTPSLSAVTRELVHPHRSLPSATLCLTVVHVFGTGSGQLTRRLSGILVPVVPYPPGPSASFMRSSIPSILELSHLISSGVNTLVRLGYPLQSALECDQRSTMTTNSAKPATQNSDEWISKGDASRLRGVSRQAMWDLVRRGRLTTRIIAGRICVSRSEVMNFKRIPRGPAANYPRVKYKPKAGKRKKKKPTYDPSKWISKIEAGRVMGVTYLVIADLIRRRRFRTLQVEGKTLVLRSAVENFKPLQPGPKSKRTHGEGIRPSGGVPEKQKPGSR